MILSTNQRTAIRVAPPTPSWKQIALAGTWSKLEPLGSLFKNVIQKHRLCTVNVDIYIIFLMFNVLIVCIVSNISRVRNDDTLPNRIRNLGLKIWRKQCWRFLAEQRNSVFNHHTHTHTHCESHRAKLSSYLTGGIINHIRNITLTIGLLKKKPQQKRRFEYGRWLSLKHRTSVSLPHLDDVDKIYAHESCSLGPSLCKQVHYSPLRLYSKGLKNMFVFPSFIPYWTMLCNIYAGLDSNTLRPQSDSLPTTRVSFSAPKHRQQHPGEQQKRTSPAAVWGCNEDVNKWNGRVDFHEKESTLTNIWAACERRGGKHHWRPEL